MDFLTHLFLPLTVAYVLRPSVFRSPAFLGLGIFGLFSDFDKFLRMPGMLHSLVTLVPICGALLAAEYYWRDDLWVTPVVVALIASHLVLDLVDGGPVPLLYPFFEQGFGLQYPARTVFSLGTVDVEGSLVAIRTGAPDPENRTYGFITGAGVASMLAFATVYLGSKVTSNSAVDGE
jgi:hypothetical protein